MNPGANAIEEERKIRLREIYQSLDPLKLLNELEHLQDQFWAYAYKKTVSSAAPSQNESIEQNVVSNESIIVAPIPNLTPPAMRLKSSRTYRRSGKPHVPHTWRTRKDPFADVWGQVQLKADIDPSRIVKELFLELQQHYPGKFSDGQLRTLQRRLKQRRREQLYLRKSHQESWFSASPESQMLEGL